MAVKPCTQCRRLACSSVPKPTWPSSHSSSLCGSRALRQRLLSVRAAAAGTLQPGPYPIFTCASDDAVTPGTTKVMQVYESKQLDILEKVMLSKSQLMGYFVADEVAGTGASGLPGVFHGGDYEYGLGNLVKVIEVRKIQVGAIVRMQSEGRVQMDASSSAPEEKGDPSLVVRAMLKPLPDTPPSDNAKTEILDQAAELRELMRDVQNLCMKYNGEETANMQAAMYWVDNEPLVEGLPGCELNLEIAYRLSFAALQMTPEMSSKEQFKVVQHRIAAMETFDTPTRLKAAAEYAAEARNMLAAKIALKSLGMK